jgi:hypothetical protein
LGDDHDNTGTLPLVAGQQYVIFVSIDKDYEKCQSDFQFGRGFMTADFYPGGAFVFSEQRRGREQLDDYAVGHFGNGEDLAFRAELTP